MRICFYIGLCLVTTALPARPESNPSWWGLAPMDATAIVGIQWQNLRSSPFAEAIWGELDSEIGLPPLPCLADARQILIASPALLAMISGNFNTATLARAGVENRDEAGELPGRESVDREIRIEYRAVERSASPGRIARLPSMRRSTGARRNGTTHSPLLSRAARMGKPTCGWSPTVCRIRWPVSLCRLTWIPGFKRVDSRGT